MGGSFSRPPRRSGGNGGKVGNLQPPQTARQAPPAGVSISCSPPCRGTRLVAPVAFQATSQGRCRRQKEQRHQPLVGTSAETLRTRSRQAFNRSKSRCRTTSRACL